MQLEMTHPTCPLCKLRSHASTAAHTPDTRLCEQCQATVLMAFRGTNSMVASSRAMVQERGTIAQVEHKPPELEHAGVGAPAFFEEITTAAPACNQEARPSMAFEPRDEPRSDSFEEEYRSIRIHPIEADSSTVSGNGSSPGLAEFSGGLPQSTSVIEHQLDHQYVQADDSLTAEQPPTPAGSALDSGFTSASQVEDRREERPAIPEEAATDPWDAPLQPWDYSHSEWPVLVGPKRGNPFTKSRNAIAAIVVLISVAGFYFLIYRPSTPERRTATGPDTTARVSTVAEARVSAPGSADSDAQKRAASTSAEPSAASQPPEPVAREAVVSNENSNAQGHFSLQAAAFPTQPGADEFAEKLKRAGIPSYVVPAEVSRRGRWFRVRVGRFNAAEEAQRFAVEAQQRARAAGLSVELIVCQYGQP